MARRSSKKKSGIWKPVAIATGTIAGSGVGTHILGGRGGSVLKCAAGLALLGASTGVSAYYFGGPWTRRNRVTARRAKSKRRR